MTRKRDTPGPHAVETPVAALPAATVTTYPDGPLVIRGDFAICDVDGSQLEAGTTVALCRCGRSARKPFCDGSHHNEAKLRRVARSD